MRRAGRKGGLGWLVFGSADRLRQTGSVVLPLYS